MIRNQRHTPFQVLPFIPYVPGTKDIILFSLTLLSSVPGTKDILSPSSHLPLLTPAPLRALVLYAS